MNWLLFFAFVAATAICNLHVGLRLGSRRSQIVAFALFPTILFGYIALLWLSPSLRVG